VSEFSSGMIVAYIGRLYAARALRSSLGGEIVLGETGGESSSRGRSTSTVLWELTDDSSGIAANAECQVREDVFVGV
jgi:hypothetical protein